MRTDPDSHPTEYATCGARYAAGSRKLPVLVLSTLTCLIAACLSFGTTTGTGSGAEVSTRGPSASPGRRPLLRFGSLSLRRPGRRFRAARSSHANECCLARSLPSPPRRDGDRARYWLRPQATRPACGRGSIGFGEAPIHVLHGRTATTTSVRPIVSASRHTYGNCGHTYTACGHDVGFQSATGTGAPSRRKTGMRSQQGSP